MSALAHVVRCFSDENVTHVNGSVDAIRDVEIINLELILSDLDSINKRILKCEKLLKTNDKDNKFQYELLNILKKDLEQEKLIDIKKFDLEQQKTIKKFQLLSSKPTFYIGNVSDINKSSEELEKLKEIAKRFGSFVIPASIKIEQEISELNENERKEYLELMEMDEPVLNKIIFEGYKMLGLQTFFTAGLNEIRAWTIKKGDLAPNAAGVIHTNFERGFIKAEIIDYDDFVS
jgi:Predicted GTPase, probable translation factor